MLPYPSMRTIAWSALAISTANAQYVIDSHSFGHKEGKQLSPNLRGIPHFHVKGEGWEPDIMSDRVILTPPWPGNKRSSIWSEEPLHHSGDWEAELHFRASGQERGSGNLQLWYTRESQKNNQPASLYTAGPFDGLVLVVDQYEGRGGSIRGFLNDGNKDIKAHSEPDTLAFAQCNYAYRNLGRLSVLKVKQTGGGLEVKIDGNMCFTTDKVKLPENYFFGISSSSAENPDSFEVHKFAVSTTNTHTREEPNRQQDYAAQGQGQGQSQSQGQDQQQQKYIPRPHAGWAERESSQRTPSDSKIPQMLEDVIAANIKSQQDQFSDLHNRIQIINHHVSDIYVMLEKLSDQLGEQHAQVMNRVVPMHDQVSATMRNVEKVERTTMETLRDLESKDFKDLLNQVHRSIEAGHVSLGATMPIAMATVIGKKTPGLTTFLFIAVAVQIMVFGAWRVYKARRQGAPKKYL